MTSQFDDHAAVESHAHRKVSELATFTLHGVAREPVELVKLVAEQASALLGGDAVAVYLWDDPSRQLLPVFTNDPRQPLDDRPLREGEGAAGIAIQDRQTVVVDEYSQFGQAVERGVRAGLKSVEAVPLVMSDRPVGVLVIRFYGERRILGRDEQHVLNLLASLAAPALEAARLYASSAVERQHERTLREITSALAENLDERKVLELAVHRSAQLLQAHYARVWLFEPNGELSCAAAEGYVGPETFVERLSHDSTSGRAARQQIANLGNAPSDPGWHFNRQFGERTGLGTYLGAGLWRAGESLGVLEVMRTAGHLFSEGEEELLISLANAVAVAVSNARAHAAASQRAEIIAESERVLRSVYEAIACGVLVMDTRGTVINANAAAEEILGIPAERMIGGPPGLIDLQLRDDGSLVPVLERPGPRAARTGQPERKLIFSFPRPDGQRRWLQLDVVPLHGPDGKVTRVVSSFIDITERKAYEEALGRRDAILQAVAFAAENLLTAPEWEQSIDEVLRQLGVATGVSRVYIVPADVDSHDLGEPTHHEWTAEGVAHRSDVPGHGSYLASIGLSRWESILEDGGIIQGNLADFPADEQTMLVSQGACSLVVVPIFVGLTWWGFVGFDDCREERAWQPNLVEALKTAAGTLGAAIVRRRAEAERLHLVREQSARVEAEAAQRRMAYVAEASQLLAATLNEPNLHGVAEMLVPGLADACAIDLVQADGLLRRVAAAGPRQLSRGTNEQLMRQVLGSGQACLGPRELIVPLVTHAGAVGVMTWLAAPQRPGFEARDLDVAEHMARRCSLAIENSRLYHEARAAVSLRDEFLSVAAHELKTPMTSLRGYAQLLSREWDRGHAFNPDRARRAAQTIQVQTDKLAHLIAQLLDVSRLQSGKLAVERRPADLSKLLREVIDATRPQLKEHTLVARLPAETWVLMDPLRMEQVVTNLLDNAIKYSPEGGQIDIALCCEPSQDLVKLTVRDRGVGVSPEHREHIFDRFYQAHAGGPLTGMAGMGLGLYISRQIVEMHAGSIVAEFPEDGGTRVVVRLPSGESRVESGP